MSIKPARWVNAESLCLSTQLSVLAEQSPARVLWSCFGSPCVTCSCWPLSARGTHGAPSAPSSVEAASLAPSRGTVKSVSSEGCEAV